MPESRTGAAARSRYPRRAMPPDRGRTTGDRRDDDASRGCSSLAVFGASAVEMVEALTIVARRGHLARVALRARGRSGRRRRCSPCWSCRRRRAADPLRADRRAARRRRRAAAQRSARRGCARRGCERADTRRCTTRTRSTPRPSPRSRRRSRVVPRRDAVGVRRRLQGRASSRGPRSSSSSSASGRVSTGSAARVGRGGRGARSSSAVVGALVARQLSTVPENSIKLVVGVMLTELRRSSGSARARASTGPAATSFLLVLVGGVRRRSVPR